VKGAHRAKGHAQLNAQQRAALLTALFFSHSLPVRSRTSLSPIKEEKLTESWFLPSQSRPPRADSENESATADVRNWHFA
jgi:hypothetical protein